MTRTRRDNFEMSCFDPALVSCLSVSQISLLEQTKEAKCHQMRTKIQEEVEARRKGQKGHEGAEGHEGARVCVCREGWGFEGSVRGEGTGGEGRGVGCEPCSRGAGFCQRAQRQRRTF